MKIILFSAKAQHGKDASAIILKELMELDNKKVLIAHYADLLKYIAKTFFEWNGEKDNVGRTILQKVGTDNIRKQQPDYWVDFIVSILKLFPNEWDYVLIPDGRFPNEINKMREYGFDTTAVRVNRLEFESNLTDEQKMHISETALDNYLFDYYICSKSGLEFLNEEVEKLYEHIQLNWSNI